MAEYNYSAQLDIDMAPLITSLSAAQKELGKLRGAAGDSISSVEEMDNTLQDIGGADILGAIVAGFEKGGQAARKAADDLQFYRQVIEDIRRETAALAGQGTEAGTKATPLQRDETKAALEEERAVRQAIAQEVKAQAEQEKAFIEERTAIYKQQGEERKSVAAEVAAEQRRADEEAMQRRQALEAREQQSRDEEMRGLRAAIQARADAAAEQQKIVENQEKAMASYSGNIFQAQVNEIKEMSPALREAERGTQQYATAMQQLRQEQDQFVQGLSNARYAMFDVSRVMGMVSAVTLGVAGAATATAASFERSFADVARTVQGSQEYLSDLEQQLRGMSTRMPASFDEIAGVASLGGQLDIAAENIEDFTETVIQFASTTDVSVERAAEALGRLTQLSGAPQSEISNLGAAIYDVGTNAVATEGQIIAIAEEIAVAGRLAGFTAQETVGLAGALASLGVQPQAARGSIQRIFQDIGLSVEQGGDRLEQFASVSGMAADEFAAAWRDTPQVAFTALVEGLGRVADQGGNVAKTLQDIGVTGTRDIQVMASLAANTEVYASTLDTAGNAYAENTALAEGYETVSKTLTEQLTIMWNTLKAIAGAGLQPLVKLLTPIIGLFSKFAEVLYAVSETRVGATLLTIVTGLTALLGLVTLAVAGFARVYASIFSLITGFQGYARSMAEAHGGNVRLTAALRDTATQLVAVNPLLGRVTGGMFGLARGSDAAAAATGRLGTSARMATGAVRGLLTTTGIGIAFMGLTWVLSKLGESMTSVSGAAGDLKNDMGGLAEAIRRDTAAAAEGAESFSEFTFYTRRASEEADNSVDSLDAAERSQQGLAGAVAHSTDALEKQTVALGEHSAAWLAHSLANNEKFTDALNDNIEDMERAGVDMKDVVEAAFTTPGEGVKNYFDDLISLATDEYERLTREMDAATSVEDFEMFRSQRDAIMEDLRLYGDLKNALKEVDSTVGEVLQSMELQQIVANALGIEIEEVTEALEDLDEVAENFADGLFDSVNATIAMDDALIGLHESIAEHGNSFDIMSENGVANMQALENAVNVMASNTEGDMAGFANGMADIFAHVELSAGVLGDEVDFLRVRMLEAFNQTYGIDLDISSARQSIHQFIADAIAAVEARAQLEREYFAAQRTIGDPTRPTFYAEAAGSVAGASNIAGTQSMLPMLNEQIAGLRNLQTQLSNVGNTGSRVGDQIARGFDRAGGGAGRAGRAARNAGKQAREAQEELRTLVDYANDLDSVWNRAFDIRFGVSTAKDTSADALQAIKDRAEDAAEAIRDSRQRVRELRAELQTLAADRSIMQYHLSVAVEYGDDLRATQLRAELAENNAEAASTTNDLSDEQKALRRAQDEATTSLSGNTEGARRNRAEVLNLVQAYQAEIIALAESGASTDQLNARTAQLRAEFVRQLTQMGYNRSEVNRYAKSFDDLRVVINNVPRNITVRANTNPAQQALNEFVARNRNRSINMRVNTSGLPRSVSGGTYRPSGVSVGRSGISTPSITTRRLAGPMGGPPMLTQSRGGIVPEYRATGGVHGLHPGRPKGTDTVPAWLTPGEFTQSKKAVDHYGLPFMNALNNLKFPKYLATGGGGIGGSSSGGGPRIQPVELLPHQMRQLADMVSVNVSLGDRIVANAANSSNVRDSQRGRN